MLSPNELEALPKGIEKQFKNLENRIMADIVRRLKNTGEMTASAGYQIERLMNLGVSQKDIENLIGDTLQLSQNEVSKIYNDTIRNGYAKDAQFIKSEGGDVLPYKENKSLQQLIGAVSMQTNQSLKNITQSMGFAVKQNGKMHFKPIADYYQQTLDSAVLDITSGAFDYDTVLQRTVKEMTNSGLRTVDYASGHSDRVDVAARRAVMTGVNQVTARITEQNMEALDTEYVEVSWHSGARPSHQEWQGKIYHWNRGNGKSDENMPDNNVPENSANNIDNFSGNDIIKSDEDIFKENLKNGKINTIIEKSQQQKHQLTKTWKNQVKQAVASNGRLTPKSRLNKDIDPQEIINKYAGTGKMRFFKNNNLPNEFIKMPDFIGYTYDAKTKKYVKTKQIQIKYTKNGVHVFPTMERTDKE